jgi:hypothetical protein
MRAMKSFLDAIPTSALTPSTATAATTSSTPTPTPRVASSSPLPLDPGEEHRRRGSRRAAPVGKKCSLVFYLFLLLTTDVAEPIWGFSLWFMQRLEVDSKEHMDAPHLRCLYMAFSSILVCLSLSLSLPLTLIVPNLFPIMPPKFGC